MLIFDKMRYDKIDKKLFIQNRIELSKHLEKNSVAILNSNDIMPTNSDGTFKFKQNSDLFYLSGIDQEETIFLFYPDSEELRFKEILFIKKTNDLIKIWEGEKLSKKNASEISGISSVYWLDDFDKIFEIISNKINKVYLNTNEHLRAKLEVQTRDDRFKLKIQNTYVNLKYLRLAPIMHKIRSIKSSIEVELISKACNITKNSFKKILKFVKPNIYEYEIEAEIISYFTCNKSNGFAYQPIIASGSNSCILHYISNNQRCKNGDIILMDFGAEYANYCSDMTRCIPANGRFSQRQKEIYLAVLNVLNISSQLLKPGILLKDYHEKVGKIMEKELLELNLITKKDILNQDSKNPAYKKYFMHGASHFLGLDVHDVGLWDEPIKSGMVFTCEPGIYVRNENIGIRLENNYLVTDKKTINLMQDIPIEIEEIENIMNS